MAHDRIVKQERNHSFYNLGPTAKSATKSGKHRLISRRPVLVGSCSHGDVVVVVVVAMVAVVVAVAVVAVVVAVKQKVLQLTHNYFSVRQESRSHHMYN